MVKLIEGVDYEVKDNYFEPSYFLDMQRTFMSPKIPWSFEAKTNNNHPVDDNEFYFHSLVYMTEPCLMEYEMFLPLWNLFQIRSLMRIKANCYPSKENRVVHSPHVDQDFSHKGAIISINSCDGYTILEDGTKIESVANRVLFFDPGRSHSSTNCTNAKARFNINVNWL